MASVNYPWITVIIPQKDRAEYLYHTLKTCMIQEYPFFEIIVSDDCSQDNSVEIVRKLSEKDTRIVLYDHHTHLGMRANFEFALSKVKPGYVLALGGDDALVPGCIWRMYELLTETNKEILTWTPAGFTYPDVEGGKNIFYIRRKREHKVKIIQSNEFLNRMADTFMYQIDECPMLFMKAIASTNLIQRVKSRTNDNCFYSCPTPDGYSGIVLAGEVADYAFTYEPLTIGGTTIKSQGRNYQRTDNKSRQEAEQFFKDNELKKMHPSLASQPYSPLVTLMTADYLLTASDLPGWNGKFKKIDYSNLIKASFNLISTGSFEKGVLIRELKILYEIAKYHHLEDLFFQLMKKTQRKVYRFKEIHGFVITNSIRFEGSELGINNIYDAALATNFVFQFYNKFSLIKIFTLVLNTFKVVMRERIYINEKLPSINQ